MAQLEDRDALIDAYNEVRDDNSQINWCALKYDGNNSLRLDSKGEDFEELKALFGEDERVYAYLRVQTGDEMSRRMKFVFLSWVGPNVGALKKAKMSTDKAVVKSVFVNFAIEMLFDDLHEVTIEHIKELLIKAGGANYGTGQ